MSSRPLLLLTVTALSLCLGCGGTIAPPATVPVTGRVTWEGEPIAGAMVEFHPQFDIGKVKYKPFGETLSDGTFTLSTGRGGNGAPTGLYAVTIKKPRIESDIKNSGIEIEVDDFNGRYSDPATSPWKITIKRGSNVLEPFQLKR